MEGLSSQRLKLKDNLSWTHFQSLGCTWIRVPMAPLLLAFPALLTFLLNHRAKTGAPTYILPRASDPIATGIGRPHRNKVPILRKCFSLLQASLYFLSSEVPYQSLHDHPAWSDHRGHTTPEIQVTYTLLFMNGPNLGKGARRVKAQTLCPYLRLQKTHTYCFFLST